MQIIKGVANYGDGEVKKKCGLSPKNMFEEELN